MPSETASDDESSKSKPQISMRQSKLTAAEAALLAGELNKPSWQSKNEGIHERVSFEDSIWGFDLAGGSFYKTPLRVTYVKPDSRAEKAGIRAGDRLKRINDIDTSTLTIQEAHEIIIESGVWLRLAVTAPEDTEDSYGCWEDQIEDGYDSEEERRKEKEKAAKRIVHAKVSSYWSLQWPWVSKRRVIYRESNCFMVPSKFESKHRDKFPLETNFGPKVLDDIVLQSTLSALEIADGNVAAESPVVDGDTDSKTNVVEDNKANDDADKMNLDKVNGVEETAEQKKKVAAEPASGDVSMEEPLLSKDDDKTLDEEESVENPTEGTEEDNSIIEKEVSLDEEVTKGDDEDVQEEGVENLAEETEEEPSMQINNDGASEVETTAQDDEIIDEVLQKPDESAKDDEDKIFNDILNDSDAQTDANAIDENKR